MRIALFPFDHAARPEFTAFSAGFGLEGSTKVRSNFILRTLWLLDGRLPAGTVAVPHDFRLQGAVTWPKFRASLP
jgi:hypothetical protein